MRILITGAKGFIGSNLIRKLLKRGEKVGVILREDKPNWRTEGVWNKLDKYLSSLNDLEQLESIRDRFKPEVVFHLATYGSYPKTQKNIQLMLETNVMGTANLVNVFSGIPIINTGSSSEYGIKYDPMNENDSCYPNNDYGLTKLTQTLYCKKHSIPTLRFFSIYGSFEEPTRLIPTLIKSKINNLEVHLINSVRDYCFVEDALEAYLKAYKEYMKIPGEIINISSGVQSTTKDLISILNRINPKKIKINWDFREIQTEPVHWLANIKKSKRLLGWESSYSLEGGLKRTYDWWKKYENEN